MTRSPVVFAPAVIAVLLALTACDPGASGGSPSGSSSSTRTPTPTATSSATPTPSATAEEPPAPPAPPAETPLSARGAYDRCIALAGSMLYAGRPVTPAPFTSANVIPRTDGLLYVYTEVTVNDAPDAAQRDVAYECVLGGTVENPRDEMYGAVVRSPLSARDPNAPLPSE